VQNSFNELMQEIMISSFNFILSSSSSRKRDKKLEHSSTILIDGYTLSS